MQELEIPQPSIGDDDGVVVGAKRMPWHAAYDVVVVGFGGAGASAAIEAHDRGAKVLVIDRFDGGGATKMSGGIYYAGGGTQLQEDAGYRDTPENMFKYLKHECADAVPDEVLREFCDRSKENFEWLSAQGVHFPSSGKAFKTSYPPDDCTLYFSGNEICWPYNTDAEAAPRGHRPLGKGMTGRLIFSGLRKSVEKRGIDVWRQSRAVRLATDSDGNVVGIEIRRMRADVWVKAIHQLLYYATLAGSLSKVLAMQAQRLLAAFERAQSDLHWIRARAGVVLSTGGFVFNGPMMTKHAPNYAACSMRLGTPGDMGDGIRLGQSAGGAVDNMDRCSAFIFINPPSAWVRGVIVGRNGQRICNEEYYGSTIGVHMIEKAAGKAVLVLDDAAMETAREQMATEYMGGYQKYCGYMNNNLNREMSWTLAGLEEKAGFQPGQLTAAIATYNADAETGKDAWGKNEKYLQPLTKAPYYAIDLDTDAAVFPTPHFTIGGLKVAGLSQGVVRADGSPIAGLYACGRTAVGISSHSYVSGLSVADCIFSGRNAGRHAAARLDTARAAA